MDDLSLEGIHGTELHGFARGLHLFGYLFGEQGGDSPALPAPLAQASRLEKEC